MNKHQTWENYEWHTDKLKGYKHIPTPKPLKPSLTVTSYQDLLYKSEKRKDYLELMFLVVRERLELPNDYILTREYCVKQLNTAVKNHGTCYYIVDDITCLICDKDLRETDEVTTEPLPMTLDESYIDESYINFWKAEHRKHKVLCKEEATPVPRQFQPGELTEYGWYDAELERRIVQLIQEHGISRTDAITRIFREGPL